MSSLKIFNIKILIKRNKYINVQLPSSGQKCKPHERQQMFDVHRCRFLTYIAEILIRDNFLFDAISISILNKMLKIPDFLRETLCETTCIPPGRI